MSEWTSRISEHRVWNLMKALGPILDSAVRLDDIDPSAVESLERLRSVLALSGKRLGGSDPLTVPTGSLDAIANTLDSQKSEVEAFISDRNTAHLVNANGAADTGLIHLAQIPGVATPEELVGLMQSVGSYRSAMEEHSRLNNAARKEATLQIEALTTSLAQLKVQFETERQKVTTQAAEQQKLFADAQDARGKTFSDTVLNVQGNLTKTLTDQQGQFSTAQESRNTEFTTAQREAQKRLADLLADYTKRLTDRDTEFGKRAKRRSTRRTTKIIWSGRELSERSRDNSCKGKPASPGC